MTGMLEDAGGAVDAALVAREVERARAGAPAVGHDAHAPCANCGTVRQGPYCHGCGQAGHVHRTAGALVHDIAHGVFHFEGKIWRTLPMLALRPGELTRRYVNGERVRFVSPMALFLFAVFLMFAVVSNLPSRGSVIAQVDLAKSRGQMATQRARTEARIAALEAQRAAAETPFARRAIENQLDDARGDLKALSIPALVAGETTRPIDINTGWGWLDDAVAHASANPALTLYKVKTYSYKYSWALIPISLPFLWLLFAFRRDIGLYDHAIFAIYSLSFMSLGVVALSVLGTLLLPAGLIVLAALLVPPVHMYKQLKGAYALGRFGALWRTVALLMISTIVLLLYALFLFWMGSE